jgi:hypothetical protein
MYKIYNVAAGRITQPGEPRDSLLLLKELEGNRNYKYKYLSA